MRWLLRFTAFNKFQAFCNQISDFLFKMNREGALYLEKRPITGKQKSSPQKSNVSSIDSINLALFAKCDMEWFHLVKNKEQFKK